MSQYLLYNGAMQTTSPPTKVTTSAVTKTMMQVVTGTTNVVKIIEWGCSFDGNTAATPGIVELIETNVAATVTAYVQADITPYNAMALLNGNVTTAYFQVGTALSGYTATAEGTITTLRNLDGPQLIAGTNQFIKQFPLGREPIIQVGKFARIRVTFGTAVSCLCYMICEF